MSNFIESKLTGDLEASLSKFEAKIQGDVLISGAAGMAKVLYDEARDLCPVSEDAHYFYGKNSKKSGTRYYFTPGTLKASIYRTYSSELSTTAKKTYRVAWNHQKAPYGFMVEFGTSRAPAHPFLRPAFDRMNEAIKAGMARMKVRISGNLAEVAG